MTSPPRLAEWLLQRLLDDDSREAVSGDLHEAYEAVARERGPLRARLWYWSQALGSVVVCRISGKRVHDARRFDFDTAAHYSLRDLLRPAFRQFRDHPLYALACVFTLALAVGAASASLAVVKRALLDPLPYRDADQIVSLLTSADGMRSAVSPHVLEDLRASNPPLSEFAPIRPTAAAYTVGDVTENVNINFVTADYFTLIGVTPVLGRTWTAQEAQGIVVSDRFWSDKLERAPNVVGTSVVVDGRPRTIVGVMPEDFVPPYFQATDVWAPLDMTLLMADIRTRRTLSILARRSAEVTQTDLDAYMALFSRQMQERFPQMHGSQSWVTIPLRDELVGTARPALVGTAAAALLLLLIVGANIGGLSTAHAVATRHQLAVRAALGASRGRLILEQAVDSVVLAVIGSVAGVWVGYALVRIIGQYQQFFLVRLSPVSLDGGTIAISLTAGCAIGIAAALLPRTFVNPSAGDALRAARGGTADVRISFMRTALVVAQVAIALVLLVGAGLLVRTVHHLSQRELGFSSDGLTWMQVNLPGQKYQSSAAQIQFERDVLERLRQIRGVDSATASVGFPLWGGMMAGLALKGEAPGTPRREVAYLSVSPNFVGDIGARIVAGRDLQSTDTDNAPRVVVINETMARLFWPNGDAIGAQVQIGPGSPQEQWITVVGVMADMRAHGLTEPIRPTAFGSTLQYSWPRRHLAVRTAGVTPTSLAMDMRAAVRAADPTVAFGVMTTAEQMLTNSVARFRLVMLALGLFAGVAMVLCISGLYAVIALSSQQRRREYAIRMALGARRGGVRWMVVRQALGIAALGATVGLAGAAFATQTIQGLLHGVQPIDAATFVTTAAALLVLATLAAWQPASQAERVNPVDTLRAE